MHLAYNNFLVDTMRRVIYHRCMTRTSQYHLETLAIGDSIVVTERFQHARVAASEYARRNNACFTCRMQDDGSMIIYRVNLDQRPIDARGRRGKRKIVSTVDPTALQFQQWLGSFAPGSSYTMPRSYSHLFVAMIAWCELYSIKTGITVTAHVMNGELLIKRS
jgi:hypothetical protein